MPKNGCCSLKVGLRWEGGLEALQWAFPKPHPQVPGEPCSLGFWLASMGCFVSPDRSFFFLSFPGSSNSSAVLQSELDGLVLVRDQRPGGKTRGLSILKASRPRKNWASKRKLTYFTCCEEETDIRDSPDFTSVCLNCCLNLLGVLFGCLFFLENPCHFVPTKWQDAVGFGLFSLAFWGFVPVCVCMGMEGAEFWQFN